MEKECFRCGLIKPLTEFYRHPHMADGHLNKCKACTKVDVSTHRAENVEKIREYDRKRSKTEHRRAQDRKRRRKKYVRVLTPEARARNKERQLAWLERNRVKRAAHIIVGNALKSGRLKRQSCERCGAATSHAHHEDYLKPLDVMWLCTTHHGERHREINEEKRKK